MAKSRRAPSLVVRAPRHASRRVRPALAAEIRRIAKYAGASTIDLDVKLDVNDPTHPLGVASDNASEWNSLLITARAERGPQWDVATQRFMVDYGSNLYFDPAPLNFVKEPTPVPEDVNAAAGPSMGDPSASWQADPRFAHYNGGNSSGSGNMSNVSTPTRTSLRLQQHQQQQQQQQHPHQPLNGYGNHIPMGSPYPYGLPNGRPAEQQHYAQAQAQVQMQTPHSYFDGGHSQGQSRLHTPGHAPHAMPNGIAIGGGTPIMARQISMSSGIGMGIEYGGGPMGGPPETPTLDARRRTRSQQEGNIEMGW